jgi:hypothetical protein
MNTPRGDRLRVDQAVTVTVLGNQEAKVPARVTNASTNGLGLVSPRALPAGTALKVDLEDAYILGEAVYCKEEAGGWVVGVELSQVLNGLSELGRRLHEYAPAPSGGERLHTVDDRQAQNC